MHFKNKGREELERTSDTIAFLLCVGDKGIELLTLFKLSSRVGDYCFSVVCVGDKGIELLTFCLS